MNMMTWGVKMDSRISAIGPRRLRKGSNKPQLLWLGWFEGVGAVIGAGVSSRRLPLERLLDFPAFPGTREGAARLALTAVRRAAVREVAYDICPSFAPFSMGPVWCYYMCGCYKIGSDLPFSQLFPLHSTVKVMISRVLFPGPHIIQYLVFVRNIPPFGTSGVAVLHCTLTAFSKSYCSRFIAILHFVCRGPTGAFSGLM